MAISHPLTADFLQELDKAKDKKTLKNPLKDTLKIAFSVLPVSKNKSFLVPW
jgi:hypothetical protein